jgi:hypothetical protein
MKDETAAQHCVACGQVKLPSDYWTCKITYWQDLAVANRKVAEDNQTKLAAVTKRKDECSNGWDEALAQRDKARDDALEDAAKVCETHQDDRNRHDHTKDAYIATLQCAAAIRQMKVDK